MERREERPSSQLFVLNSTETSGILSDKMSNSASNLRNQLRWVRPDGSVILEPFRPDRDGLAGLAETSATIGELEIGQIIRAWQSTASPTSVVTSITPGYLEADGSSINHVSRSSWLARSDWLATRHQAGQLDSSIEVAGDGRVGLAGKWTSPRISGRAGPIQPGFSSLGSSADVCEWSFRIGRCTVTRSVIFLKHPRVVILSQGEIGHAPVDGLTEMRFGLADGASVRVDPRSRALVLASRRGKIVARLIPLGLPMANYPTNRGSLVVEGDEVVLRGQRLSNRRWTSLALALGRPPSSWRCLTVSEQGKACPDGTAIGFRIGWGVGREGVLFYRSLKLPALRSVLGHQTRSRFVIGGFSVLGEFRPWARFE